MSEIDDYPSVKNRGAYVKTILQHYGWIPQEVSDQIQDRYIYFILSVGSNEIKIGSSIDPCDRLSTLQTGNAARLKPIKIIPGSVRDEKYLHRFFAAHRIRTDGEWFRYDKEIRDYVKRLDTTLALEHQLPKRMGDADQLDLFGAA